MGLGKGGGAAGGGLVLILLLVPFCGTMWWVVKNAWNDHQEQKRYAAMAGRLSMTGDAHRIHVHKRRMTWEESPGHNRSGYEVFYDLKFSWVVTNNDSQDHWLEVCIDEGYLDEKEPSNSFRHNMCTTDDGLTGKRLIVRAGQTARGAYIFEEDHEDPRRPLLLSAPYIHRILEPAPREKK